MEIHLQSTEPQKEDSEDLMSDVEEKSPSCHPVIEYSTLSESKPAKEVALLSNYSWAQTENEIKGEMKQDLYLTFQVIDALNTLEVEGEDTREQEEGDFEVEGLKTTENEVFTLNF